MFFKILGAVAKTAGSVAKVAANGAIGTVKIAGGVAHGAIKSGTHKSHTSNGNRQ